MRPNNAETADHGCHWVIWFCACVRYWPDYGLVFECVTCFYCLFLICHFYFWSDRSSFMKKRVKRSNLLQPLGEYQNPLSLFLLPVLSKAIFFYYCKIPLWKKNLNKKRRNEMQVCFWWKVDMPTVHFAYSCIHSFVRSFVRSFLRSFFGSFIYSLIYSLFGSLVRSSICLFVLSFVRSLVSSLVRLLKNDLE